MKKVILIIFAFLALIPTIKPVQAVETNTENSILIIYDDGTKVETQQMYNLQKQKYIETCFNILLGFIMGITLYTGIKMVLNGNKKLGIIQLLLTFLVPIFTFLWFRCSSSYELIEISFRTFLNAIFSNTYAIVFYNLILIAYIFLIALTVYNTLQIRNIKGGK